jgi:hypothetical protein
MRQLFWATSRLLGSLAAGRSNLDPRKPHERGVTESTWSYSRRRVEVAGPMKLPRNGRVGSRRRALGRLVSGAEVKFPSTLGAARKPADRGPVRQRGFRLFHMTDARLLWGLVACRRLIQLLLQLQ